MWTLYSLVSLCQSCCGIFCMFCYLWLVFFVAFACILGLLLHTRAAFLFCMQKDMKKLLTVLAALLLAFSFGVFANDLAPEVTEEVVAEPALISSTPESVERVAGGLVAVSLQDAIDYLYANGLTMFATEETFMGSKGLRRDEAAAFFARFARDVLGMEVDANATGCDFSDLATAHQDLLDEIAAACQLGLMRGSQGKFMPTDTLSNAHAMTVLVRLLDGDKEEPAGNWAANYAAAAKAAGLTAGLAADSAANLYTAITRADVAKMIEAASVFVATETPAAPTMNIVETASANEDFSTLVDLVVAADLAGALSAEGPFTVFAPINEAFAALDAEAVAYLTSEEGLADLTNVLTYHVVEGKIMAADIVDGMTVTALNGLELTFAVDQSGVYVNGIKVVVADIQTTNGVIHVIDFVIVPESE
jgi:uncharacterized surface protein with fasciclin (FAS1) repeats